MSITQLSTLEAVRNIVDRELELADHGHELGPEDDLWSLGMTSLSTVGLMLTVEDAFDIEFPEELLNEATFSSVNAIAAAVELAQKPTAKPKATKDTS